MCVERGFMIFRLTIWLTIVSPLWTNKKLTWKTDKYRFPRFEENDSEGKNVRDKRCRRWSRRQLFFRSGKKRTFPAKWRALKNVELTVHRVFREITLKNKIEFARKPVFFFVRPETFRIALVMLYARPKYRDGAPQDFRYCTCIALLGLMKTNGRR